MCIYIHIVQLEDIFIISEEYCQRVLFAIRRNGTSFGSQNFFDRNISRVFLLQIVPASEIKSSDRTISHETYFSDCPLKIKILENSNNYDKIGGKQGTLKC